MGPARTFTPPCGPVIGNVDGAIIRALGIPYATARRFDPPAPYPDWQEPRDASQPAPACPQPARPEITPIFGDQTGDLPLQEECQNLSVTVPADLRDGEQLPVMVWIHGGSYVVGAGDSPIYDPTKLVTEQRVVFIAVTYRLGVLGYLGGPGKTANLGLLDQQRALEWVQRNIASFGGDPARVTAFGHSAGGDAVAHLMATPQPERLFTRAIIQSSPFGLLHGRAEMYRAMAEAGASFDETTPIDELPAAQLAVVVAALPFGLNAGMAFGPQYGAAPLPPEDAVEKAWDAAAPHIDVLVGSTAEETRVFIPTIPITAKLAGIPLVGGVLSSLASKVLTRKMYTAGARRFVDRHARAGGTAYRYTFTWAPRGNHFGATHAIDVPFLFGNRETWGDSLLLRGAAPETIEAHGKAMRQVWADFARGDEPKPGADLRDVLKITRARGARRRVT